MKIPLSILCIVLLLVSCNQKEPSSPIEVIQNSLAKTSNGDQWQSVTSSSWKSVQTTTIHGKEPVEFELAYFNKFPSHQRIDAYRYGNQIYSQYYTPTKNMMIRMETEKKGFTDIPEKEVFKTPVFKLLKNVDHLKLSDSISASSRFYKLMDTITKGLYLFDKTTYLMHSEQEVSNYGKQKTTFEAYKTIGNYVVPTKITTSIPTSGYTQEEILSEVKINPSLGENVFTIDESEREVVVGRTIPNFSFQDMDNPQNQFTNSHLMGKVVLLDFWATWCKPCIKEIPNIQNLYEKYKDKDFEVLSISLDTSAELVKSFRTNRYPLNWKNTILTEAFKDIQAQNMEVSALPKVILIDKEGTIIAVDQEAKGKALEIILEKTLK